MPFVLDDIRLWVCWISGIILINQNLILLLRHWVVQGLLNGIKINRLLANQSLCLKEERTAMAHLQLPTYHCFCIGCIMMIRIHIKILLAPIFMVALPQMAQG
jgi:hypothetical protein